jgi:hypothetical protein
MSEAGRDSQSMAFYRTPGIELLYSGVTIRTPSAPAMRSLRRRTAAGMPVCGFNISARAAATKVVAHEASNQVNTDVDIEAFDTLAYGSHLMDELAS